MSTNSEHADRRFMTTNWSMVLEAGAEDPGEGRPVLAELLQRYHRALENHVRYRWKLPDLQAEDLLQKFIAEKILEKNIVGAVDPTKGKFRTFLLTVLDNFIRDELRKANRHQQRFGGQNDYLNEEPRPNPFREFNRVWVEEILSAALSRMKQECEHKNRSDLWELFDGRVLQPLLAGAQPISYAEIVDRFGCQSPSAVDGRVRTAKTWYRRHLCSVIAEYAPCRDDIDAELCDLVRAMASD